MKSPESEMYGFTSYVQSERKIHLGPLSFRFVWLIGPLCVDKAVHVYIVRSGPRFSGER